MLDHYFDSEVRRRQLRRGPLAEHIDGLAAEFQRDSYARHTARRILSVAGQFNRYVGLLGVAVADLDDAFVDRFLADSQDGLSEVGPMAMRHVLRYLRQRAVIAPAAVPRPHSFASTFEDFDRYMRDVRGLAQSTRDGYLACARDLFNWLLKRYGDEALCRLTGAEVLDFVTEQLGRGGSPSWRAHLCSQVRGVLRHLHTSGFLSTDLTRVVPRVASPRLARIPRGLRWEQVRALVDAVDISDPNGLRDKAILLLLAILGLRSMEVRELALGDIQWRAGEIRLPRTKTRRERVLPLVPEVGAALADYILHGRPVVPVPQVFLRLGPRSGPLLPNSVIYIVRRHLQRAGIRVPRGGAHMLRHSLATRMVNAGVSIKSIADLLGHTSIDTTAIYTKVDERTLSAVALPFPGGVR